MADEETLERVAEAEPVTTLGVPRAEDVDAARGCIARIRTGLAELGEAWADIMERELADVSFKPFVGTRSRRCFKPKD